MSPQRRRPRPAASWCREGRGSPPATGATSGCDSAASSDPASDVTRMPAAVRNASRSRPRAPDNRDRGNCDDAHRTRMTFRRKLADSSTSPVPMPPVGRVGRRSAPDFLVVDALDEETEQARDRDVHAAVVLEQSRQRASAWYCCTSNATHRLQPHGVGVARVAGAVLRWARRRCRRCTSTRPCRCR